MKAGAPPTMRTPLSTAKPPLARGILDLARQVEWTPVYVFFLLYMFTIVTYFINVGNIAILLALVGLLLQRQSPRFPVFLVIFAAYLLWAALGWFTTSEKASVAERLVDYGKLWLIALVAVNAIRSRAQLRFYLIFMAACYLLFPARGAVVNFLSGYTVVGRAVWNNIYGNPNDLAALTLLALGGAAAVLVAERDRLIRLGAMVSSGAFAVVMLMTQSRGALIGMLLFLIGSLRGQRRKLRSILLLTFFAAAVVMIAPADVWERVQGMRHATNVETLSEVDEEGSAKQRWEIWRVATAIIADHPVTGVGLGAYGAIHSIYAIDTGNWNARGNRDTHSTYLNVAAETGLPGLILFLGIIAAALAAAERARRKLRNGSPAEAQRIWLLELGVLAYLVAGVWGTFPHLAMLHVALATLVAAAHASLQPAFAGAGGRRRGA